MRSLRVSSGVVGVALLFVLASAPQSARAQAWIHDPGDGYAEVSYRTISADAFFNSSGETRDLRSTYTQRTVDLYAEVGVIPRWLQFRADGELFRYNELANQGATYGLGDVGAGLWTGIVQDKLRVSAGLDAGFPTGDPSPEAPGDNATDDAIAASLPTGDGRFDLTGAAAVGYAHNWASVLEMYTTATGGYVLRFGDQADAVEWRAEAGVRFRFPVLARIWWALQFRGLHSLAGSDSSSFSGLSAGASYVAPGLSVSAEIYRGFGLRGAASGAIFAENVAAAPSLQAGLFYNF